MFTLADAKKTPTQAGDRRKKIYIIIHNTAFIIRFVGMMTQFCHNISIGYKHSKRARRFFVFLLPPQKEDEDAIFYFVLLDRPLLPSRRVFYCS